MGAGKATLDIGGFIMLARSIIVLSFLSAALIAPPSSAVIATEEIQLVPVGVFATPVDMAVRPGEDAYYVVQKVGLIHAVRAGIPDPVPVLNVVDQVSTQLEQGLLGLAFSPTGDEMYVYLTDTEGDSHIYEYVMNGGYADAATQRELIQLDQPFANHNAGNLEFGPDGYLYASLGDGGSGGDPEGNGQNIGSMLGSILRIDPTPGEDEPYTIPGTNPFVGVEGAAEEIWAYGLRNPWKFSFDRVTGDLWIADVGQELWEEINVQPATSPGGENYGWNAMEGSHPYEGGTEPANHTPPIFEYGHENGACSITGGYVYRGDDVPALQGKYIYGDWCEGSIHALSYDGEDVVDEDLEIDVPQIASFGEGPDGELYALSLAGTVFRFESLLE